MPNNLSQPPPRPPQDRSSGSAQWGSILVWLVMWVFLITLLTGREPRKAEIPYSQFIDQVESGEVATVKVGTHKIEYTLKAPPEDVAAEDIPPEETLTTRPLPADADLPGILRAHDVEITALPTGGERNFWALLLPFALLWILLSLLREGQINKAPVN